MIIDDIIRLKKKHNLLEEDATDKKQLEWYDFALSKGLVITHYDNDKLLGFLEYVRLTDIPKSMSEFTLLVSDFVTGKVLLVGNCIAENSKVLWQLKRELFRRNKDMMYLVWHRKKRNLIRVYQNIRREHALS